MTRIILHIVLQNCRVLIAPYWKYNISIALHTVNRTNLYFSALSEFSVSWTDYSRVRAGKGLLPAIIFLHFSLSVLKLYTFSCWAGSSGAGDSASPATASPPRAAGL